MKHPIKILFLVASVIILLLFSCSPNKSNRTLSFFFDGVPHPESTESAVNDTSAMIGDSVITGIIRQQSPTYYQHPPYEERDCFTCHDETSLGNLTVTEPDLCYFCHEDFNEKYAILHGPVAGGFCTSCHSPHMSQYEKLLIREGQEICTWCHKPGKGYNTENHGDIGKENCTMCHNPHGGDDRYIFY